MLYEPGITCEICDTMDTDALIQCRMCSATVCHLCRHQPENICLNCEDSKCSICGEFLSSRACNNCGRLVCEDHGIKLNEVTTCDLCRTGENE